jgi:hypothetical protein
MPLTGEQCLLDLEYGLARRKQWHTCSYGSSELDLQR